MSLSSPHPRNHQALAYGLLAFTVLVWGVVPAMVRSFTLAAGPSDAIVLRCWSVAALCLVILPFLKGPRIALADWPRLVAVSWFGIFVYFFGSIIGFGHVTTAVGGVLFAIHPLFVVLLASALGIERLTIPTLLGLGISFVGTLLLFRQDASSGQTASNVLLGASLLLLAGIGWAVYVNFSRPLLSRYGAFKVTIWTQLLCAIPASAFISSSTLDTALALNRNALGALFFLSFIGTIITVSTWNYAASHLRTSILGASLYVMPLLAIIAGVIIMGEPVELSTVLAGIVILAGVAVAQFGARLKFGGNWLALSAILFAVTAWGLVPVITRYLVLSLPPETVMFLRVVPAGIIGLAMVAGSGLKPMSWNSWRRILLAAIAGNVLYQVLAVYGARDIPASWIGMLFGLEPVFIAIFSVLFAGERLTYSLAAGIAIAIAGTAVLMIGSSLAPLADVKLIGLILVTLSTMGWGIYTVAIKPVSTRHGALPVTGLTLGIAAFPMLLFISPQLVSSVQRVSGFQWIVFTTLVVVCTILATMAWNFAVNRMSGSLAGVFLYMQPLIGALTGVLLLGETLTWPLLAGGGLIVLGVAVAQFGPALRRQPHAQTGLAQLTETDSVRP